MTLQLFVPLVLALVLVVYLGIAIRTAYRLRGKHVVICPETKTPAGVTVDLGHAATTAVWEKADVRLTACSRWPGRADCEQPCTRQIEASPDATRTKNISADFFKGKRCAICQKPIEPPSIATLQPGFIDPVSRDVKAWDEVAPEHLHDAIDHDYPLCANCTLAESFRQRFPDEVVDRIPRPGTTLPPQ